MSDKDLSVWDAGLFDATDVEWEVLESKRRDKITLAIKCKDGSMNVVKTYLALKMICEKIETELNIMDLASDDEH